MKFKYICILLSLLSALYCVEAYAQVKKKGKKPAKKVQHKVVQHKPATRLVVVHTAAPHKKTVSQVSLQKAVATSLGDAAAKVKVDTAKKPGAPTSGNSLSEEIVVTTAYKPVLADAVMIRINPDLEDKTPFKAPLTYFPIDKRLELNTDIKPFNAMKEPAEQDSLLYNNYVKVGLGSLKTTFGEAYFDNGRDQALQVGGFLKHYAQQGSLTDENSNREEAQIFGKSIGETNSVSGNIDYNYRGNDFYGYNEDYLPPANLQLAKQHFSTISAEGELIKNYQDVPNDFTYALKFKGYIFSDAYSARESNVVLSGFLNETISHFYVGVAASLDFATQQDSVLNESKTPASYNINNSLIRANPYIKFQGDNYKVDAGVNIVSQFGYASKAYIFPAAKAEIQVIPDYVRLFVEAKGDVNRSSLLDFSTINPYLGTNVPIENSVDRLDLAAGLKGTILPGLGFKATVYRDEISDMPLFVSDFNFATGYNRFTVIYDNGQLRVNGLTTELDYKASDDFDIFGRADFKQYQMATVAEAWNLPTFKLTGGATIHISDKVNVTATLFARNGAHDPYPLDGTIAKPSTVGSTVDASGEAEYKITNRWSVFVHANNILNARNQQWLYYPDYGFNIFGGVGFKF
jgi:hypothetical protein